ncbi:uncharacterized protein LOC109820395 [Asparagus officinalis]|uniref:uncharacterized protein LOC109820395 n=1 Tax=Asparagus officinalis TaxID=4686 RepID=UPI00098E608C|nr:uncharacterized protein LOC109820395 [Asparagus officinalis]
MLTAHTTGFSAAVVYRAEDIVSGDKNDWMFSWYDGLLTKEGVLQKAYTEMGEAGHFQGEEVWNKIKQQTENAKAKTFCEWKIYAAHVEIDNKNPAHYKAVLSLRINEQPATK